MDTIYAMTHERTPIMIHCADAKDGRRSRLDLYDRGFTTATPGIVVTRYAHGDPVTLEPFPVLTHLHSGCKIGGPYRSLRIALKVAGCLGGLGDWSVRNIIWLRASIESNAKQHGLHDWFKAIIKPDEEVLARIRAEAE